MLFLKTSLCPTVYDNKKNQRINMSICLRYLDVVKEQSKIDVVYSASRFKSNWKRTLQDRTERSNNSARKQLLGKMPHFQVPLIRNGRATEHYPLGTKCKIPARDRKQFWGCACYLSLCFSRQGFFMYLQLCGTCSVDQARPHLRDLPVSAS